jgi:hypothetical protein
MGMEFSIGQSIEFGFSIGGGGSPAPAPGIGAITGTPTVQMSGAVLPISSTIYGTAEEVE